MKRQVVNTNDDSPTLFVPGLDQHYHSVHGALQESEHVFIEAGWRLFEDAPRLRVLEVGFGTGLNALLTALKASQKGQELHYHGLEKYPLKAEEWHALDYAQFIKQGPAKRMYQALHSSPWESWHEAVPNFHLLKQEIDLRVVKLPGNYYSLIYFDAFAPTAQDYLWTEEIFSKMYQCLTTNGALVTYCVKGSVRRSMKAAGFEVEKIPGPPGKREMARAFKK